MTKSGIMTIFYSIMLEVRSVKKDIVMDIAYMYNLAQYNYNEIATDK